MYQDVFKRVEEKYLLTEQQKITLLNKIHSYLQKDKYYKSIICNIYFDSINNDLIIKSLDKPIFKEKIRLRSYGVPSLNDNVFLEIKRKYREIVGKRRVKLTLNDFYEFLKNDHYDKDNQIMQELNYCFKYYKLRPAIYIAYDRESYKAIDNEYLRITLDCNLRSRTDDLKLELGDAGKKYFKDNYYIMEIKTLGSMPLWLVNSLSELKIYPTSFSKYGKIYTQMEEIIYA